MHMLLQALIILLHAAGSTGNLLNALKKSAGLYADPIKAKGFESTILLTASNYAFLNHLHNFKCFMDRLGLRFLVISMDAMTHSYLVNHTDMSSYLMAGGRVGVTTGAATNFRDKQYNLITAKKKEAVHDVLALGFHVIFSDSDIAVVRDPIPKLLGYKNMDYVHSLNVICTKEEQPWLFHKNREEGNTGFYYVRSNNKTVKLWKDAFEAAPRFPNLDDQAIFWRIIRISKDPPISHIGRCKEHGGVESTSSPSLRKNELVACYLSTCEFSSGMLSRMWIPEFTYEELLAGLKHRNESMHTVHSNSISGNHNKMMKMDEHGFWLATKDSNSSQWRGPCKAYNISTEGLSITEAVNSSRVASATVVPLQPMISVNALSSLRISLELSAGVYLDHTRSVTAGLQQTVLITACNHGFINHLHNFKCFADRLALKFLVFAMDLQTHHYITNHTDMKSYFMEGGKVGSVTGESTNFRDRQFNLITAKKKEAVHDVLALGYDVIFSDTDVVMIRDPVPSLVWTGVDYSHTLNMICMKEETWTFRRSKEEGNTGFYYVRSNSKSIKLWKDAFEAAPRFAKLDDQAIFWHMIRRSKDPPIKPLGRCRHHNTTLEERSNTKDLVECFLSTCEFSSGMLSRAWVPEFTYEELLVNVAWRNESIHTVHANYLKGNHEKMARLEEYGFWLATKNESTTLWNGRCKAFNTTDTKT